ncbi:glucose 1-dehydrogenase [Rhizobium sp. VS19-DR104.2]|uniref:glucose 1-dehydrogenase n=1 Tax=unclassified Rhizobium TaxID=2613769 RepID=UPI001ADD3965|nr:MULTISPECIES: glucose 1-dehydrogenase [unclassified Rhizobium]MBO9101653.1 glucose 1-dehydrogenase [Rhizobium sp. L58/93]MBO9170634.1 glucose 1-dehydrogenase [Rhizobium sp. L245/93]MBO9187646.1 glucose 1-dehydrogenase [Rhizobium sp. E27B/91]MBZ5761237.1 glucose 1-dehydrogenase [Rhizobium sp. VS19-DR96]MBZ5766991.1 glucose 1-dehydrogenase [Rhizobium sp. VS19-DR129.2]
MTESLEGRVVIVTGSGRGIGAGIAGDLASKGAKVVIADLVAAAADAVAATIRSEGGDALGVAVDVSDRSSVKELIARTVSHFGRLDVMFNNAGISQTCPFLDVTEDDFNRIMKVNGLGVLIGTQEAAKTMIAQGTGGKIINTASIAGKQGYPLFAHYCASKFAVVAITQAAARALAEHKITVNCFGPGVVATELWQQLDREFMEHGLTSQPDQAINEFSQSILLGRVSVPKDIAGVTTFLASAGSDYITGQTVMVDGGMVLI